MLSLARKGFCLYVIRILEFLSSLPIVIQWEGLISHSVDYDCSDFVDYKATMQNFPNMLNESIEKNYVKNRKTQHKHLNTV